MPGLPQRSSDFPELEAEPALAAREKLRVDEDIEEGEHECGPQEKAHHSFSGSTQQAEQELARPFVAQERGRALPGDASKHPQRPVQGTAGARKY